jgi:hypothetical protein
MSKLWGTWRFWAIAALAFPASFILSPVAHADIIEIESRTGCPGSVGGGLCNGSNPYNLTVLLSGGITLSSGTQKFVVEDTTGSFTIHYTGSSGDNGSCQINGGTTSLFSTCEGVNGDSTTFSLGHDDTHHPGLNGPATITFTAKAGECTAADPCFFDLGFVSWQGSGVGSTPSMPEPGTLSLLASGLLGLAGFARRRLS